MYDIQVEKSELEIYGGDPAFGEISRDLNLVEFSKSYEVISSKAISRKKLTVNRSTPKYSLSPCSPNFGQCCQYQLTKYKPWENTPANAWNSQKESDCIFVHIWKEYLQPDQGVRKVPN